MPRVQHVRSLRALVAGAWLGLSLAACQAPEEYYRGAEPGAGQGGSIFTGVGGSIVSGAGGSIVSGAAGTVVSGAAGTAAAGTTGTAGTTATAGTSGAAGSSGTSGAAGTTGTAGTTGMAGTTGAAGRGGTSGTTGSAGRGGIGGTTAAGGRGGRGGSTGAAGSIGTAGTNGGANSCPLGGRLDCTSAGSLELAPDGQVVDFSAAEWNGTATKWCDAHGLDGGWSAYAGTSSTATAAVDMMARNLRLNLMVGAGQYAGGRLNFDSCVDATTFNSIQFTASVSAGSLTGCIWQVQVQTQNQRPTTLMNPTGGTCNAATTTCERYPAASLAAATATATTFTVRFTSLDNPAGSTIATPSQIAGLQWQVNSGNSGSGTCTVELRIDNVRFVTQ